MHTEFRTVQALLACENEKMNLFRIHIKICVESICVDGADILCRAAHLQHAGVFELHGRNDTAVALHGGDQHLASCIAHVARWHLHRCERREDHLGIHDVIQPNHGKVPRHGNTGLIERLNDAVGRKVVYRDDGGVAKLLVIPLFGKLLADLKLLLTCQ